MVAGNIKIALNLRRVQIQCQYAVCACLSNQIGHQFSRNRFSSSRLSIGSSVAVVGEHRRNLSGRRPVTGINHNQQFHQVVIHRMAGRLNQIDIAASNRLLNLNIKLAIGKVLAYHWAEVGAQIASHFPRQRPVG